MAIPFLAYAIAAATGAAVTGVVRWLSGRSKKAQQKGQQKESQMGTGRGEKKITPGTIGETPILSPQQQKIATSMLDQASEVLGKPYEEITLEDVPKLEQHFKEQYPSALEQYPTQEDLPDIEEELGAARTAAKREYEEEIIPGLQERFAAGAGGLMSSSGYRESLMRAGQGLTEKMHALESKRRPEYALKKALLGTQLGQARAGTAIQQQRQGLLARMQGLKEAGFGAGERKYGRQEALQKMGYGMQPQFQTYYGQPQPGFWSGTGAQLARSGGKMMGQYGPDIFNYIMGR